MKFMDNSKFSDFFDDNDVIDTTYEITSDKYLSDPSDQRSLGTEGELSNALSDLGDKYKVDFKNLEVKDVLGKVSDLSSTDNETFELAASKIVTDYASRVALKGVIIQAHLLDKVFDLMDNTKVDQIDADTFLLIDKAFNYQDKLFSIIDRYKKPGVEESLRHLAKVSSQKPEETPKLSTSEMQMIIDQINKAKSKELEGGDNDSSK